MPKMNGLEVLEDMNRTGKIKHIPVFLITAAESMEMLMEGGMKEAIRTDLAVMIFLFGRRLCPLRMFMTP